MCINHGSKGLRGLAPFDHKKIMEINNSIKKIHGNTTF